VLGVGSQSKRQKLCAKITGILYLKGTRHCLKANKTQYTNSE